MPYHILIPPSPVFLLSTFPFMSILIFFFNDTATTEIYTLSLHDALPISWVPGQAACADEIQIARQVKTSRKIIARLATRTRSVLDRKSTRLNSSHVAISYAVFCLKKKKTNNN